MAKGKGNDNNSANQQNANKGTSLSLIHISEPTRPY